MSNKQNINYYLLDFNRDFAPLYGDLITIPSNTIFWRGYDPKYPSISDRPAYFGNQEFAQGYAQKYGTNAMPFINKKQLRLLDIRFMKVLLSQLFANNFIKKEDEKIVGATSLAFGLSSLQHQIKIFKNLYKKYLDYFKDSLQELEKIVEPDSIFEQPGVRIAETSTDAYVMGFLKVIFSGLCDGFISPNIESAFHIEKNGHILNSEMILFNPIKSNIVELNLVLLQNTPTVLLGIVELPNKTIYELDKLPVTSIHELILKSNKQYEYLHALNYETETYLPKKGGAKINKKYMNDYNHLIDTGNKAILRCYNEGIITAGKWLLNKKGVNIKAIPPAKSIPYDPDFFTNMKL